MPLLTPEGLTTRSYPALGDETPIPEPAEGTVSTARYLTERQSWDTEVRASVGVHVDPDEDIDSLAPLLQEVPVVVLRFGKMADGRAFSKARLLRHRYQYAGCLVADGPLVADQFAFLIRCGFDAVAVSEDIEETVWRAALTRHRHAYQPRLFR